MPPRRFDGEELRIARRKTGMSQAQLAKGLGLTAHVTVANWENGKRFPSAEKLGGIAAILGVDVDRLFPREGPCDLLDLRCDAGYTQTAVAQKVEGLSRFDLGDAEGGRRRLASGLIEPLSRLYGVGREALEAAQDRSFPGPPTSSWKPQSLAEKLTDMASNAFPGDPASEALSNAVTAKTGTRLTAAQVEELLAGRSPEDVFAGGTAEVVLTAIAAALDVPRLSLEGRAGAEGRVLADLRYLAAQHDIALLASGDNRLSPAMLAVLADLVPPAAK
ncbi:helix-turn-helix protein [Streptomyces sp. 840.1]|uniref:helix-turn-helix transcriptional regulator n=1 Tax=Streptomyces sp. 840.1 TaxID=2485152 RepID=UPI000FBA860C|nr:helix-turn-helix transcriptional regulator [Streptomyces sp. 840.1]ROQ70224.1 helix-turn-helix protein [Streptomyces sp. 840.1]